MASLQHQGKRDKKQGKTAMKQVIMMHPDSLWAGSQLAMAVQAIKR